MISQMTRHLLRHYIECALIEMLDFAESSPEMVEWDEVEKIFSAWAAMALMDDNISDNVAGKLLGGLSREVFNFYRVTRNRS